MIAVFDTLTPAVIVLAAVSGILCAVCAPRRDRSALTWFGIGVLLPVIGLLILVWIPRSPSGLAEEPAAIDHLPLDQRYDHRIDAELGKMD